ncbi:hypothetical protein ACFWIJ_06875 [Streptomyces sp. NPDC127079]|uniref:hypothetical protein n=1 Tax=Streptomyces sp. NPDC127079 TaxID=3347132 RepID=UPI00365C68AA
MCDELRMPEPPRRDPDEVYFGMRHRPPGYVVCLCGVEPGGRAPYAMTAFATGPGARSALARCQRVQAAEALVALGDGRAGGLRHVFATDATCYFTARLKAAEG